VPGAREETAVETTSPGRPQDQANREPVPCGNPVTAETGEKGVQ